ADRLFRCVPAAAGQRTELLGLLGFLQGDLLAGVTHALALVRLRWTERADLRRHFADALLVGPRDQHFGLRRHGDRDAFRRLEHDRVGKTKRQVQVPALQRRAIADADQLELALIAFGDALDHVRQQRTRRAGHLGIAGVFRLQLHLGALHADLHALRRGELQRALRPLDGDRVAADLALDALRQSDRLL